MITMKQINASVAEEREAFFQLLDERTGETNQRVTETVQEILKTVKAGGDDAVKNYTLKFDGSLPEYYEVPREVINDALTDADQAFVDAMLNAIENVRDFHQRQVEQGFIHPMANGVILGQRVRGLERVGLYVPGGTAAYPSSVIMNAVPAKIAGIKGIYHVVSPKYLQMYCNEFAYRYNTRTLTDMQRFMEFMPKINKRLKHANLKYNIYN